MQNILVTGFDENPQTNVRNKIDIVSLIALMGYQFATTKPD